MIPYAQLAIAGVLVAFGAMQTIRLTIERKDHRITKAALMAVDAAGKAQEKQIEYVNRDVERVVEVGRKQDAAEIVALRGMLGIALDSLRESGSRQNLKPADSAPAQCRDHAAGPEQLSVPHAEFLVREAAAADQLRVQWAGCVRDYNAVRERINSLSKP